MFQLGTNSYWRASHVIATAGTNYVFSTATPIFSDGAVFNLDTNLRCIAGCVKVRYIGSESNRSGTIGLLSSQGAHKNPGVTSSIASDQIACPFVVRTGEVQHEVKFVPSAEDETFITTSGSSSTAFNSCMSVTYKATPAQTIQFEVTGVYEVESMGPGTIVNNVAPSSGVTLNQLLRALGPVTTWAYGHVIAPTIRSMAGAAQGTLLNAAGMAARSMALMTI